MGFKPKCPMCGSKEVVPIEYGMPSYDAVLEQKAGKLMLGGCCVSDDDMKWYCRDCDYAFRRAGDRSGEYWEEEEGI